MFFASSLLTCFCVKFEMLLWPWVKVKVVRLSSDYLQSKLDQHCLKHFWNNRTFIIFMIKICVNTINMWCILMSEAVTVPSLKMITSTVSEESLARNRHTNRHTASWMLTFFTVLRLWKQKEIFNSTKNECWTSSRIPQLRLATQVEKGRKKSWVEPYCGCSLSPGKAARIVCALHWDKKVISTNLI